MLRGLAVTGILLLLAAQAQAGADHSQSLPLVVVPADNTPGPTNTPTSTVTATATNTPTATQVPVTLWPNGDFEQGEMGWTGVDPGEIAMSAAPPVQARSGEYMAILGGQAGNVFAVARLSIFVPESTPYLSYWVWIRSTEPNCNADLGSVAVQITNSVGTLRGADRYDVCVDAETNGWANRVVDLTNEAGELVDIEFSAEGFNGVDNSTLYIDDIGWRAIP